MPAEELIILRDDGPGEPDVTLNPRTEFYRHRVELEVLVTSVPDGGADAALDNLIEGIAAALAPDPWLSGLAENLRLGALDVRALAIEGAVPILATRLDLTVEYLVDDPLAAHW